jgi:WD40 repeat protein
MCIFENTHDGKAITSMAFDTTQRRLITGSDNGEVKAWNFSSGRELGEMVSSCRRDITGVELSCRHLVLDAHAAELQLAHGALAPQNLWADVHDGSTMCNKRHAQSGQASTLHAGIVCPKGTVTRYVIAAGWDRKLTFFEDSRAKHVASCRQVPPTKPAHDSDILACALMDGSPNLVTASSSGELRVWNIESGSLRHTLARPGLDSLQGHRRSVEALAFLRGRSQLRHVCLAVGHDQVVHCWDVQQGRLLFRFFTGDALCVCCI